MGASDISGIGKVLVQTQTQGAKGGTPEEELQVAFTEVMSQMQTCVGDSLMSGRLEMNVGADSFSTKSTVDTEYERYGSRGVKIGESSGANKMEQEQLTEKLEQFAEDVKEVLKEELGVSEEQIAEAMEALGLTFSDLLNVNQLASLVAELTGTEDMGKLLCSEEFVEILNVVDELGEKLLQELGISGEELSQMLADMQNIAELNAGEQMLQEDSTIQDAAVQETITQETDLMSQKLQSAENSEEQADVLNATEEGLAEENKFTVDEKTTSNEQESNSDGLAVLESDEETITSDKNKNGMFSGQQKSENSGTQARSDMTGSVNQNVTETTFAQTQESVNGTTSQLDVSNIMKQIVEFSRVTLNNNATTMEMQLNPEHLGKIYLELTAKDGVVSAHITAQNEAVKEALESQLVEFKQNMNQAGVKVDAVEVTVGSHEFEKNLEQNAKHEQQQAEEQEKAAKQTRHINLNDLDELSGIMTEEESLVAQMMADQGNSVDFTA